jgi:hypothetical protein
VSRSVAVFSIAIGIPLAAIDAWLSMQSLIGIMNPESAFGFFVASGVGLLLTAIAIVAPIVDEAIDSGFARFVWWMMLTFDIATSCVGTIWYAQLGNDLTDPVDFSQIHFAPGNALSTLLYIFFVLTIAALCYWLGWAFKTLLQ